MLYTGECEYCPYKNLDTVMSIINDLNIPFSEIHIYLCKNIKFQNSTKISCDNISNIWCINYNKYNKNG